MTDKREGLLFGPAHRVYGGMRPLWIEMGLLRTYSLSCRASQKVAKQQKQQKGVVVHAFVHCPIRQ